MVALATFLMALMQTMAQAEPATTSDLESDNAMRVYLFNEESDSVLVISRSLDSGDELPLSSVMAKSLEDGEDASPQTDAK